MVGNMYVIKIDIGTDVKNLKRFEFSFNDIDGFKTAFLKRLGNLYKYASSRELKEKEIIKGYVYGINTLQELTSVIRTINIETRMRIVLIDIKYNKKSLRMAHE